MRKLFFFLAFSGLVVVAATGAACGSESTEDADIALPERSDAAPTCTALTTKVSDRPPCDKCAKERCCAQIRACNDSEDCAALQSCLEPCAQDDIFCILACQTGHESGATALQEVGSCARNKCKAECPTETPDADIFDAP